jgi:hypothetical protein
MAHLADRRAFLHHLSPARKKRWVVCAKAPFAGPEAVFAYLSRYTHRVAISNRRLIAFDQSGVTFRYKDYRRNGADRQQVMTLAADEFIRRFLLHVLPRGFHRIRHYGLLASSSRKVSLALARELLDVAAPPQTALPLRVFLRSRGCLSGATRSLGVNHSTVLRRIAKFECRRAPAISHPDGASARGA